MWIVIQFQRQKNVREIGRGHFTSVLIARSGTKLGGRGEASPAPF